MTYQTETESAKQSKLDIYSVARNALARAIRPLVSQLASSAESFVLLEKICRAEKEEGPFVATKLLERVMELYYSDRPSTEKKSPGEDTYMWVYLTEVVLMWLWFRRGWSQYREFSDKWIIRLTAAVLKEAEQDEYIRKMGYWKSPIECFIKFSMWNDDPKNFLLTPSQLPSQGPAWTMPDDYRERLERNFKCEQDYRWWELGWIHKRCLCDCSDNINDPNFCQTSTFDARKINKLRCELVRLGTSRDQCDERIRQVITMRIREHKKEFENMYFDVVENEHVRRNAWKKLRLTIRLDKAALLYLVG